MNNNITGNNTMTTTDKKPRVAKKTDAPTPIAAPAVAAAAPVAAAVAEKKPRAVKAKVAEAVVAAPAAVAAPGAAPEASPVSAAVDAAPTTTVNDDIRSALESVTRLRDEAQKMIVGLRKLDKRVSKEIKEARKRRRSKREVDPLKPKGPNVFEKPQQVTEALCKFFGKPVGTQMSRAEVTSGVSTYIKKAGLQNKHEINPDAALKGLLGEITDEKLTYFNIQKYLNKHYIKTLATAAAAAAAAASTA